MTQIREYDVVVIGAGPGAPDLITLQEVRAANDIALGVLEGAGYTTISHDAEAKGRAGVAVMAKAEPLATREGIGSDGYFDRAGRWLETDFRLGDDTVLTLVSAYVHSGEAGIWESKVARD